MALRLYSVTSLSPICTGHDGEASRERVAPIVPVRPQAPLTLRVHLAPSTNGNDQGQDPPRCVNASAAQLSTLNDVHVRLIRPTGKTRNET